MKTKHILNRMIAGTLLCLLSFTAYGHTGQDATDSLLVQRGLRLTGKMRQLAGIPRYLELMLTDSAAIRVTRELAIQAAGMPCRIFTIGNLEAALKSVPLIPEILGEAIPDGVRGEVMRRMLGVLPPLINKELDAETVALFAVLCTEDVFRCEGLDEPVLLFYQYKGSCHSMVLFIPYPDNLVKVEALFVMNPNFNGVLTAEDIRNAFAETLLMDSVRVREINGKSLRIIKHQQIPKPDTGAAGEEPDETLHAAFEAVDEEPAEYNGLCRPNEPFTIRKRTR